VHWIASLQLLVPMHDTSHAHELPHDTVLHVLGPVQLTSHLPVPHWTPSHAL
jgi:hypothetical protein